MKIKAKPFRITTASTALCWVLSAASPLEAADLVVTRYFSGLWDQPQQESQGIMLQVIDQEEDGSPRAVAYWFTYGDDLDPFWYVAIGHVDGDRVVTTLYTASGVSFMQDSSPELSTVETAGELILSFRNCNHGVATYMLGEGDAAESGEFEIKRLAALYNSRCTGGISDNTPSDAKPLMLEVALTPPDEGEGKGKARFWERTDRSDLHISVEYIADGSYGVRYCAEDYPDVLQVVENEGAVAFRSPEAPGKEHLLEDPRNCTIEVYDGGGVVLSSGDDVLGEKQKGQDKDKDGTEVEVAMQNVSVEHPAAEGELKYEVRGDSAEFEVEIEGAPAGTYGFFVAGNPEGDINVDDSGKGKLKFSDPQKDGQLPLNFEPPWDKMMEVRGPAPADATILEAAFPSAP
jgi:hypothetical protein